MTSLAALVLVDRGELDLDANVATYWPEFAARGKAGIKVRQLLSHTSGVSGWDQPITLEDLYDWDKSTALLAAQAPWWEPGTASGYHALTYGHLIGEVIRRITGQRLGEFFAAHIAGPLGADFHIGLPPSEFHRVANVVPPPARRGRPTRCSSTPTAWRSRRSTNPVMTVETTAGPKAGGAPTSARPTATAMPARWRASSRRWPAAARSMASGCSRRKTIDRIFEVQSNGIDLVIGIPIKMGRRLWPAPEGRVCFLGRCIGGSVDGDRRGSPHDLRLRDEQDGAGRRDHRSGAGRAGVRHRESLSHAPRTRGVRHRISPQWPSEAGGCSMSVSRFRKSGRDRIGSRSRSVCSSFSVSLPDRKPNRPFALGLK